MRGFLQNTGWSDIDANWEDVILWNKNNTYRASHEARSDGEKEYKRDRREMVRNNDTYCNMIGRSYESILKYGV